MLFCFNMMYGVLKVMIFMYFIYLKKGKTSFRREYKYILFLGVGWGAEKKEITLRKIKGGDLNQRRSGLWLSPGSFEAFSWGALQPFPVLVFRPKTQRAELELCGPSAGTLAGRKPREAQAENPEEALREPDSDPDPRHLLAEALARHFPSGDTWLA
jgi:hypothetical protein